VQKEYWRFLKPQINWMRSSEGPVRWKERGVFYPLSFPFLFVIGHNNNNKKLTSKGNGRRERKSVCVIKHLVNFCVSPEARVNFSPNSDDKMISFKCLLPIWPEAQVPAFSSRSLSVWSNQLYLSKEKQRVGAATRQFLETANGLTLTLRWSGWLCDSAS
jgi:hypothetical protein